MNDTSHTQVDHRDAVGIVRLSGEVDIVRVGELREQVLGAIRNEDLGLVVDLTGATYIDSVGVSLMFELAERLSERQLRLAVVLSVDGLVRRVLTIVNLSSVAWIHTGVEDALSAIHAT